MARTKHLRKGRTKGRRAPPRVPDHHLLERIGRGGYGEVWLARNVLGTFRAVKVVFRKQFQNERPYQREFDGIKKFEPVSRTHPGLVSILHIGQNERRGYFYYVMELADDATAGQAIASDNYSAKTLSRLLTEQRRLREPECIELGLRDANMDGKPQYERRGSSFAILAIRRAHRDA